MIGLLFIALIWTYITLIHYFFVYFTDQLSDRKGMVDKVFKIEVDQIDKGEVTDEEEILLRKLMKKYERVELQVNFNNTRNQLLSGYDSIDGNKPLTKDTEIYKMTNQDKKAKQILIDEEALKRMEE